MFQLSVLAEFVPADEEPPRRPSAEEDEELETDPMLLVVAISYIGAISFLCRSRASMRTEAAIRYPQL